MRHRAETVPFQHGPLVGQCLTESLVYKLYSMLLWFPTSFAVGFDGRNWHRLSSVPGHWSPGGVLLVLHQGRFVAICAMHLAGNTCNMMMTCRTAQMQI